MPDGSIVLMGGDFNDTWRSTDDGTTWTEVTTNAGWAVRSDQTSVSMPDGSIVLMGGGFNDTWRLQPVGSSLQNPSHTYTTPGAYQVTLQAYNDAGYSSTLKTGYIKVNGSPDINAAMFHYDANRTGDYSPVAGTTGTSVSLLWQYPTYGWVSSSPTVANGVVYVGSDDDNIYALGAINGTVLWSYSTGGSVGSSPAVANGIVYAEDTAPQYTIYALDASNGTELWSQEITGSSSPAIANGVVYIGSDDNNIYALNAATGSILWTYPTGGTVDSSPAVANGIVYAGSSDGNVYALDALTGQKI
jgi:outer membrane protein assembly factor BamB